MSVIDGLSPTTGSSNTPAATQVKLLNSSGEQLEAVMATLLEGIETAASVGTSGGSLIAVA